MANKEFMFPFASVVKVTEKQIPEAPGAESCRYGDHFRSGSDSIVLLPRQMSIA